MAAVRDCLTLERNRDGVGRNHHIWAEARLQDISSLKDVGTVLETSGSISFIKRQDG